MELPTSPLSYKGSISEAITEAQTLKKLFVVFISGNDNSSESIEQSILVDKRVVDAVQSYCIFLHLHAGTDDASQFALIYPQKSVPSISVIGYNGVMTSQHDVMKIHSDAERNLFRSLDGCVSVNSFLESIKKGWENMKLQETTVALLTAALASRNLESSTLGSREAQEKGSSSTSDATSSSEAKSDTEPDSKKHSADVTSEDDLSRISNKVHMDETSSSEYNSRDVNEISETEKEAKTSNSIVLTDVLLSIRLPNGSRLQLSSPLTDNLQLVKKHVIENDVSNVGPFDLAIPYPRKVFTDQDMDLPLSELGFSSREALIVVPRKSADAAPRNPLVSFQGEDIQRQDKDGSYFALLKRIISFVNPFSYFGGGSQAAAPVQTPAFQRNMYEDSRFLRSYGSDEGNSSSGNSASASQRRGPTTFGGNIHTLRDVEREDPSSDRNLFWNGNSTEFGGDGKK